MSQALWESGQLPGLSGPKLIGIAWRMARPVWPAMVALWVVCSGLAYASGQLAQGGKLMAQPGLSTTFVGFVLLFSLAGALVSAATLRTLLRRPLLALDGGLLGYVAIIALTAALVSVGSKLLLGVPPDPGDTAAAMAFFGRFLGWAAAMLVYAYLGVKLMLWPIGLLVGDLEVTPGKSWQLTHRAFWGYVVALILVAIVPYVIVFALTAGGGGAAGAPRSPPPAAAPFAGFIALAGTIIAAALFHARRSPEGEAV